MTQSEFGGAQHFIYTLLRGLCRCTQISSPSADTQIPAEYQRKSAYPAGQNQRLSATDYEVVVAAGPEGDDENGLLSNLEKIGINTRHLKYLRRSINPFFDFLGLIEICGLMKKEKPDILFLCSSKAGFLGSLAHEVNSKFKIQNSKLIYRIGGWTFNDPWPKWKKRLYVWFEKKSAKWKDYIINNSLADKEQAISLGIKPKREIITIYNGLDLKKMEFLDKEESREKLGEILKLNRDSKFKVQDFIVGTVANFYPAKGLSHLIEAANLIRQENIKFVIIGEGKKRRELEDLIHKNNLEEKFNLTGTVPQAYRYLKAFDVFVLPSLKEGFPWTILEAMVAEVPVIATTAGALPEIIENNKSGILVRPADSQQLAEAISNLLKDRNLREELAKEAYKTVEERFTLEKMVREIERLLYTDM